MQTPNEKQRERRIILKRQRALLHILFSKRFSRSDVKIRDGKTAGAAKAAREKRKKKHKKKQADGKRVTGRKWSVPVS